MQNCKTPHSHPKCGRTWSCCVAPPGPRAVSISQGRGDPQPAVQGGNPEPGNTQTLPGHASPGAVRTFPQRVLPPRPTLVETPSPQIQLRINPSHAGAALPRQSPAPPGSVAFGDRCPFPRPSGAVAPERRVLKAISKHELTHRHLAKGAGSVQDGTWTPAQPNTWKTSRETAKGQNPAVSPQSRGGGGGAAAPHCLGNTPL